MSRTKRLIPWPWPPRQQPKPRGDRSPRRRSRSRPAWPLREPASSRRSRLRRVLIGGAGLAAVALGAYYGWYYWTVGRFQVSTDDADVQADTIAIAPKVSGYLSAVLVGDNEPVKAGQVLARIDDRDYKVALQQADADVAAAQAAIASKQAAIETQGSVIDAAKATIQVDQDNEIFAEQENKRYVDPLTGTARAERAASDLPHRGVARQRAA